MEKFRNTFSGLNDGIIKGIPKWANKVAQFMAGVVRLGLTAVRTAGIVFNAVKRIFDMIPKELKIIGGALAAFAMFIRAGPIGKLVMIITAALLLLEDFYAYLDGGDALFGKFWQRLIDIYTLLKDLGVFEKLQNGFLKAMSAIQRGVIKAKDGIISLSKTGINFFKTLNENGTFDRFKASIREYKR
jgi:hypothetical protein